MRRVLLIILGLAVILFGWFLWNHFRSDTGSLQTQDKDGNGVWDDVDERIRARFKDPHARMAAEQEAKSIQDDILHPDQAKERLSVDNRAESCFAAVLKIVEPGRLPTLKEIEDFVVINSARDKAYLEYNVKLSGSVWSVKEDLSDCDFDTSGLVH